MKKIKLGLVALAIVAMSATALAEDTKSTKKQELPVVELPTDGTVTTNSHSGGV